MEKMQKKFLVFLIVLLFATTAHGKSSEEQQVVSAIDPVAIKALQDMGTYLRSLETFSISSTFFKDEVLLSGQKVLVQGRSNFIVKKPHHLFISLKIDEKFRDVKSYFDGKNFSVYSISEKYYASMPFEGKIQNLVEDVLQPRFIEIPLKDIFIWGTKNDGVKNIQSALKIASSVMNGVPCDHYIFQQESVDWQIWIQQGDKPLPQQLVITTKLENEQPQHITRLKWDLNPKITNEQFSFVPPPNTYKVEFLEDSFYEEEK